MTPSAVVRPYQPGDEEGINRLFNDVFGLNQPLAIWLWKFTAGPVPKPHILAVAEDENRIVGLYGSWVQRVKAGDQTVKAVYALDNAIYPEYRGGLKGVQFKLFEEAYRLWLEEGIPVGFGFPNRAAFIFGKRRLKYGHMADLEVLYKRLNYRMAVRSRFAWLPNAIVETVGLVSGILYRAILTRRSRSQVKVAELKEFPHEIDVFWKKFAKLYPVMIVRDRSYLNWRYAPQWVRGYRIWIAWSEGEIVGMAVGRLWDPEGTNNRRYGLIMELATLPPHHAVYPLLQRMLLWFVRQKADGALARLNPYDPIVHRLKKLGFKSKLGIFDPYFVYRIFLPGAVDKELLGNPESWHISLGDSDGL